MSDQPSKPQAPAGAPAPIASGPAPGPSPATPAVAPAGAPSAAPATGHTPLDHISLFAPLTAQVRGELAAWMQKRVCAAGEIVFNEGDPGDAMYVVEDGYVSVFVTDAAMGLTVDVASLGRGEAFGEMALVTGEGRKASVLLNEWLGGVQSQSSRSKRSEQRHRQQ